MNNESITLIIYGGLTFLLAFGGIYTLRKGFQLIMSGRGKSQESSSINFLGLHVSTGSIGAFVMITALKQQLVKQTNKVRDLKVTNTLANTQLASLKVDMTQYIKKAEQNEVKWSALLNDMKNRPAVINTPEYNRKLNVVIQKQKIDLSKFKSSINIDDGR